MNSKFVKRTATPRRVARVRLSELKAIIREAVEDAVKKQAWEQQQDEADEKLEIDEADLDEYGMDQDDDDLDEGWGDDTDYTGGSQGKGGGQDKYEWKPEEEYKGSY